MQEKEIKKWIFVVNSLYRGKSTDLFADSESDNKYPSCKAVVSYVSSIIINEINDEYLLDISQTVFQLSSKPSNNGTVKMFINGIIITKDAYSVDEYNKLTYNSERNNNTELVNGDRVNIIYFTKGKNN